MQYLGINSKESDVLFETQRRLSFSLPRDCKLKYLVVIGPDDEDGLIEDDFDDEDACNIDTIVDLSILKHCEVSLLVSL